MVSVLRNCTENSSQLAAAVAASAAARTATRGGAVDPNRVQQIVEMGFSQAQAEEALRRVSRGAGPQQAGFGAYCCWVCRVRARAGGPADCGVSTIVCVCLPAAAAVRPACFHHLDASFSSTECQPRGAGHVLFADPLKQYE